MVSRSGWLTTFAGLALLSGPTLAQGFDPGTSKGPASEQMFSFTPSIGHLRSVSTENVYDPMSRSKISQLDWKSQAMTLGGRAAVRPFDGVVLRGSLWAAVASQADMRDRDWLFGYEGDDSWSHQSLHPDTRVPKAWQADVSVAYRVIDGGDFAISALAGFRHYDIKYRAYGGSYVYSQNGFRDAVGSFDPSRLGISYRQQWDTPYLGLGTTYRGETLSLSAEVYGSPASFGRDRDYHALRYTLFTEKFAPSAMIGANLAVEYPLTTAFSIVGRVDYTKYFEAKGGTRIYDAASGQFARIPKPGAGADAEALNVSLGVRGKI